MRNWNNTIGLLLPVRLQRSVKLRRLLQLLLSRTVGDALRAERRKEELKAEHLHIGQSAVLLTLLRERFGQTVSLSGQEDGRVVLLGSRGSGYERWATGSRVSAVGDQEALIVPSVANSDVGVDFVVTVDAGTDVAAVKALVKRYAFAGIGFRIEEREN